MTLRRSYTVKLLFFFVFLLASCTRAGGEPVPLPEGTYPVDPLFRDLYASYGEITRLGPAISPVFEKDGVIYQYVDRALMMFNPDAPRDQRLRLAPLGRDMGVYELPASVDISAGGLVVEGYPVYEKFTSLFQELGGLAAVGKPLSGVHKNVEKNRYEQFFENLGFYWVEGDPPDAVGLLSYGAWKCDVYCRHAPPDDSRMAMPTKTAVPFLKEVARLGLDFTGYARSEPYLAPDGSLQQIFDNLVMVLNPQYPDTVDLLPLSEKLGLMGDALQTPPIDTSLYFYPVQGGLGYNIPPYFIDYIQKHGGMELVGAPVSQLSQHDSQTYRQCFRNICLEAQIAESGETTVAPVHLGLKYRDLFYRQQTGMIDESQPIDLAIQVWEDLPMVSPNQEQVIGVVVYGNNQPLIGNQPELTLTLPDGTPRAYVMPPTDDEGESKISIEPLDVANGTLIPYKVCVAAQEKQKFCVIDSYLVWITEYVTVTPLAPVQYTSYIPFVIKHIEFYVPVIVETFMTYLPLVNHGQ
jgi:hypothetical protein